MSPLRSLRIYNRDPSGRQISLHLQRWNPTASPGLRRRGAVLTPVLIPSGAFLDVCKQLGVSFEDAERIVKQSPEAQARKNAKHILIREHPPFPETLEREAKERERLEAAKKKTAELNPPDPPDAVPVGVNLEAAGFDPNEAPPPRMTRHPDENRALAETLAEASVEGPGTGTEEELLAIPPEEVTGSPDSEASEAIDQPSMNWTARRLKKYAEDNGITLGRARSKTTVLRRIREVIESR